MIKPFPEHATCRHDNGFFCSATYRTDVPPYIFACNRLCGFWMNFSPDSAGAVMEHPPSPVGQDMWRLHTVAFLMTPSDRGEDWKVGPRSVPHNS